MLTTIAVAVLVASTFTATSAFAQSNTTTEASPMTSLAQKIAEKFGLNQDEVQTVINEVHEEHRTEIKAKVAERLSQLVTDGKITEAQKQLILDKQEELASNRQEKMESIKNMTDEERKAAFEKEKEEVKAWADENGIDLKYLMFHVLKKGGMPFDHEQPAN